MASKKSNKLYVYGKFYGRFDVEIIKERVDEALVERAFEVGLNGNDDARDAFMEEVEELDSFNLENLFGGLIGEDKEGLKKIKKLWDEKKAFGLFLEEFAFGIAPNGKDAKAEYVNVDSDEEEGDEW